MKMTSLTTVRMHRRAFAMTAAGAALLGGVRRACAAERLQVALDWYPNSNHAGLFLAEANGWYDEAGLDVVLTTPADPTTVLQTVAAGRDDLGISYQTDVLLARAAGVPVVSVAAISQVPLVGIMTLAEAGIATPADLKGKVVAYPGIPSQEAFLDTMLAHDGLTRDDIELVNVGFDLLPALVSGKAAGALGAFWTHEPIVAEREGYPTAMLKVEEFGVPPYYELVLVASEDAVSEKADAIRTFLEVTRRGYEAAAADPAAALAALQAASPEMDAAVEEVGITLVVPTWTDGEVTFGTQTAERWDAYGTWMKERELIPEDLVIADAWTDALLPEEPAS